MIEAGDGAGFGQVRLGVLGPGDEVGVRHLDGHETPQLVVLGQVDQAEAALAKKPLDTVATDVLGVEAASSSTGAGWCGSVRALSYGWFLGSTSYLISDGLC